MPHTVDTRTGRSVEPCRSARPRTYRDAYQSALSRLESAVELRLGEKRAGHLQDFVGPTKLFDLALQFLDTLRFGRGDALTHTAVDLFALDPAQQGLRNTADLGGDRFHRQPERGVLTSVLLHHAHGPFADFGGELVRLVHSSIFSKVGASTKPGAIQSADVYPVRWPYKNNSTSFGPNDILRPTTPRVAGGSTAAVPG